MHGKKMALALWFWLAAAVSPQADDSLDTFGVHGAGAVMVYSLVMTALLLWITSLCVSQVDESDGLDITRHAERLGT